MILKYHGRGYQAAADGKGAGRKVASKEESQTDVFSGVQKYSATL